MNFETPDWAREAVSNVKGIHVVGESHRPDAKQSFASPLSADAAMYDEESKRGIDPTRSMIFSELMLLEPPRFMAGLWVKREGGWLDTRAQTFFSFDEMRVLISQRIAEFGLDRALIDEYMSTPTGPWYEHERWRNSPVAERVKRFRR